MWVCLCIPRHIHCSCCSYSNGTCTRHYVYQYLSLFLHIFYNRYMSHLILDILPRMHREARSRRNRNDCAVCGVSGGSLSPGYGSSFGMCRTRCSSTRCSLTMPTNGMKQSYILNTCTTQCRPSQGIPVSRSDLSAIMASGKQVVSRVSQSNPELVTMRIRILDKLDQEADPENPKPDQSRIPAAGDCCDGLPQTKGGSCYSVSYGSPLHKPESCTGASP